VNKQKDEAGVDPDPSPPPPPPPIDGERDPWVLPRRFVDGVVSGIFSPVAGKGNKGQWVKVDGQAYFKAIAFEEKEHLRWVEGDDDVREKMVKNNRGMEKDIHTYSKNYLMAKGKDKLAKLKKEGRGRKKLVQVDSPDSPTEEERKRREEEDKNRTKTNAKKEKLEPMDFAVADPIDAIIEEVENKLAKCDIQDPNWVLKKEYGEKLIPSDDMGAKVGGGKKKKEEEKEEEKEKDGN